MARTPDITSIFNRARDSVRAVADRAVARLHSFSNEAIERINDAAIKAAGGIPDVESGEFARLDDAVSEAVDGLLRSADMAAADILDQAQEISNNIDDDERAFLRETEALDEFEQYGLSQEEADTLLDARVFLVHGTQGGHVRRRRFMSASDAFAAVLDQYAHILYYVIGVLERDDGFYIVIANPKG